MGNTLKELEQALASRRAFAYDPGTDAVYKAYREQYMRDGQAAMRDTVAEASGLTGGYASTYAQTAGQRQYGEYLKKLNDVLPALYAQAYDRWSDEGGQLLDRYNAALNAERMRSDAEIEAYGRLKELISATGYTPAGEELSGAGMSAREADAWRSYYRAGLASAAAGGSASVRASSTRRSVSSKSKGSTFSDGVYADLQSAGASDYGTAYAMLIAAGYSNVSAKQLAEYYAYTYLKGQGTGPSAVRGVTASAAGKAAVNRAGAASPAAKRYTV